MINCQYFASGKGYTPFLCVPQRNSLKGKEKKRQKDSQKKRRVKK